MSDISVALQKFNDKVRAMNQRRGKDLILTADEARSLHNDVFNLLAQVSALTEKLIEDKGEEIIKIDMDGGSWN